MIAVVVPVLGRPQNAQRLADSLTAATTVEHRLVWVVSVSDRDQFLACKAAGGDLIEAEWPPGPGDFARKVNKAHRNTIEPFVFQGADDIEFTPGWDVAALAVAEATGAGVVGTNDDANPMVKRGDHSTHSLIRRSYVEEHGGTLDGPGLVFSEAYGHQWCDNELVELAKARGQWAFAASSVVRHRHWVWRTAPMDETYARGSASARADRALFEQRRRAWRHA